MVAAKSVEGFLPNKLNDEHYKILNLLKERAVDGISEVSIEKALGLNHSQTVDAGTLTAVMSLRRDM